MMIAFLLFGMWVDDKIVVSADLNMYENWFLPRMNERFITNDMGEPPMMLGIEMEHDREVGTMYLHHHTSVVMARGTRKRPPALSQMRPSPPKPQSKMRGKRTGPRAPGRKLA